MKVFKSLILYISAMLIVAPCLLIISEGDTILPNIIGIAYAFMLYGLSHTKYGKKFTKEVIKLTKK